MHARSGNSNSVAIVGASSLRGKELKQVLEDRHFPATDIRLYDETVLAGTLTEAAGEPTFIRALDEDSFEGVRFAFFAGTGADAARSWQTALRAGATVIDLTGALAAFDHAATSTEAPIVTWIPPLASVLPPRTPQRTGGSPPFTAYSSPGTPVIIACTLAAGLEPLAPQRVVVLLFPPVSEHDQAGVEELEKQTANLLTFREIAKPVFDAQVAFNLLAGYGEESKSRLGDLRATIARDVARYLAGRAPLPAIQLVQAPVFYGYAFAAYAELASPVPHEKFESAFANLGVKIGASGVAAPTNVSVAGASEIHLARIEPDPNMGNGVWLWGVADNLRLAATNAVRIAEELVAQSQPQ
jgi:aspartate-semialdehyde dehydrogenase